MRKLTMLAALFAALVAVLTAAGTAGAAVTAVNCAPFGSDDLQAKINAAAPGETLLIKGTCTDSLDSQGQVFTATRNVTLQGASPGATLDGGGLSNTLAIHSGPTVTIRNLTITGGGGLAGHGGGIYITDGSTVTVVNSTVSDNTSSIVGGGIFVFGSTLNLQNSTVNGNTTQFAGGGIAAFFSTLTLNGATVTNNDAVNPNDAVAGGGIDVDASTAQLTDSTVSSNTSGANGGGIAVGDGGSLTLTRTTVSGNTGNTGGNGGSGGGIGNYGGTVTVINSSVDHNTDSAGGGLFNDSGSPETTMTIKNSSVSFNHATADDPFFGGGGGIFNFAEQGNTANVVATGLTMVGNTALVGHGGAIANENLDGAAAITTISQSRIGPPNGQNPNQAIFGGGLYNDGTLGPASLTLQPGTIVAHNQATNDGGGVYSTGTYASLSIAPGVVFLANSPDNVVKN